MRLKHVAFLFTVLWTLFWGGLSLTAGALYVIYGNEDPNTVISRLISFGGVAGTICSLLGAILSGGIYSEFD